MKKLLLILAVIVLVLPAAAMAADPDPIVGSWYVFFDRDLGMENAQYFENKDQYLQVYTFHQKARITRLDHSVLVGIGKQGYTTVGRWIKDDDGYLLQLVNEEDKKAFIDHGDLFVEDSDGLFFRMRRLAQFDPYEDYKQGETP